MAMTAGQMAQNIADNMNALGISDPSDEQVAILSAMCEGIIKEIQDNATVTTVIASGSSSGTYQGDVE